MPKHRPESSRIVVAPSVGIERAHAGGRVVEARRVLKERGYAGGRVVGAPGVEMSAPWPLAVLSELKSVVELAQLLTEDGAGTRNQGTAPKSKLNDRGASTPLCVVLRVIEAQSPEDTETGATR